MKLKRHFFWVIYLLFVFSIIYVNWHEQMFSINQQKPIGKILIWLMFIGFSCYTIYCSMNEHFMKSLRKILAFHWGKQIGLDLTLGLIVSLFVIYWHSGSLLFAFLWLIPCIAFGNLTTLLYFAIHYETLVSKFLN
jgi:hypothetical protein